MTDGVAPKFEIVLLNGAKALVDEQMLCKHQVEDSSSSGSTEWVYQLNRCQPRKYLSLVGVS